MITNFIPAPEVKNFDNITLYRDSVDPLVFYYLVNHPRIKIDKNTKKPAFDYAVIARGIKNVGDETNQQGRLVMSVNLALTDGEYKAVESAATQYLESETFLSELKLYYPKCPIDPSKKKVPIIRPITFKSGKASINLAAPDVKGVYEHETKPNLSGDCNATFAVNLYGQESQILYGFFKPSKEQVLGTGVTVKYEMMYDSMVPFKGKITIHYERIYNELQNIVNEHAGIDSKYRGRYTVNGQPVYINGADLYTSKGALTNYLKNSDSTKSWVEVKIDNVTGDANNDKYEEMLIKILESKLAETVSDRLFEKVDPLTLKDDIASHYDVGTTGSKSSASSEQKRNVVYDVYYKLRNVIDTTMLNDFTMEINKSQSVVVEANPQNSLDLMLNDYDINSLVKEFDASEFYYQEMTVPVWVDNTNFGRDIAMISVRVLYKDKNNRIKKDWVFNFDEEDPGTKTFRVIMDRDKEGALIGKFFYQTKICYRGFDVYEKNVPEDAKWSDLREDEGNGNEIYVRYSDIRNLCVKCNACDVAWEVIEKMDVELKYKDAPDKKGATKLITLTESNPSDIWNCFMYSGSSKYLYRIRYYYKDGTDDWSEQFESASEELSINDKLSGIFRTKFEIDFNTSIERVRVIVRCQGKEEDSGWLTKSDVWTWQTRLKEDGQMSFQYKYQYYLVNGDESMRGIDWTDPICMNTDSNQQTIEINLHVNQIKLLIDGESIDWNKWNRVYLHFVYDDDANDVHYDDEKITPIKLTPNKCETTVVIPVIDTSVRPRIFAEYLQVGGAIGTSEVMTVNTSVVILPNAAPPKE